MKSEKHTVLIAEKHLDMQLYLTHCIKHFATTVCTASGVDALRILGTKKIDLLVIEVDLPFTSSVDLCNQAKSLYPTLPIILITSRFESEVQEILHNCKYNALIHKPFPPNVFRRLVRKFTMKEQVDTDTFSGF